jgi:biopolymer transport protein TolR
MSFGRLERLPGSLPMSDINMTPLIDVMLVLLVIFMITAPLMTSSLKLDLPRSDAASASETPLFLAVAITPDGALFLGDEKVTPEVFDQRVADAARGSPDLEVQLRADKRTTYGQVAELIGRLQKAGLNRIAFVTEAPTAASR